MAKKPSLSRVLGKGARKDPPKNHDQELKELQLRMLRIQQGLFFSKRRAIVAFEGFDAAGKGGAIRRLTEPLDARSALVHPIGAPTEDEQGKHWLYRFWTKLPSPGTLAIFDRSWYGRVLVERVEKLTPVPAWKRGYREINEFEAMLIDDGVDIVKIFLAISKKEQLDRFEERLTNPYKQWKLNPSDLEARKHWNDYVEATDEAFEKTDTRLCPWHVIPADNKDYARLEVLRVVTNRLIHHRHWMEKTARNIEKKAVKKALKALSLER